MTGPSFEFIGFAIIVALVLAPVRSVSIRQWIMLLASAVFLGFISRTPLAFVPFVAFVLGGYVALRYAPTERDGTFAITIFAILLAFFWIKKYAFIPGTLWMTFPYVTLGVSYVLFRLLHLVIESRTQPEYRQISLREYLAYLLGFNTLVAGPIQMFDDYRDAQAEGAARQVSAIDVGKGAERIAIGLFKTNVLATMLAGLRQDAVARLAGPHVSSSAHLWSAGEVFALYPLFLYCNFSGYIDLVIGVSRLFVQRLPENFNRPFSSSSFIDFWNRWHITLSLWLRTYVYNPLLLASMRRFSSRALEPYLGVFAFFVTFFLVGVWHGQTIGFVFFGFLQGFGVAANKLYQVWMGKRLGRRKYDGIAARPLYTAVARGLTYTWFAFTLTWFWASWSEALDTFSHASFAEWLLVWTMILVLATLVIQLWETARDQMLLPLWHRVSIVRSRRIRTVWYTALVTGVLIMTIVASQPAPQIVYKNF